MFYEEKANYPQRGEVYYVASYVSVGRAMSPKTGRPAVVVSRNERNKNSGTVQVVYLTHSDGSNSRNPQLLRSEYNKVLGSTVVCDQIHTVDKELLGDFVARVGDTDMYHIEHRILNGLCINPERHVSSIKEEKTNTSNVNSDENSFYKRMYFELIDHLRGE